MNPCPCGYAGSSFEECQCSDEQIKRYLAKISGPLLDRIDMQVEVARLAPAMLAQAQPSAETSADVRARIIKARAYQHARQGKCNTALTVPELDHYANLQPASEQLLQQVMSKLNLSARVYHRIIKVARTIADLESSQVINEKHIGEALNYRCLDRIKRTRYAL